ncbi:Nmad3 family putative nucleotide modification protein [Halosegnis longus]|uniref:Nucleotide modification associated domain-containing protein n=1 Tax=Halosegnis longus TaxID=2216012 RepID=A0AAJ4UWJ0_9EURY|nr:hypothetical protein Nmn1133_11145 [Salella cibi]
MTRAVAVNVGANTNQPGVRAPVYADGTFDFLPIPETEQTREPVPTYGDLASGLRMELPDEIRNTPVHLDPEFAGYPECERHTYGDPHGVKARPLSDLEAGDWALFYATLDTGDTDDRPDWQPPSWGAYLVGGLRLARDPVTDWETLPESERAAFANNAHVKRAEMDAAVLLAGDDASGLFDRAIPLSAPSGGVDANALVTELSADSGKGPWWRRPLRYDAEATDRLLSVIDTREFAPWL